MEVPEVVALIVAYAVVLVTSGIGTTIVMWVIRQATELFGWSARITAWIIAAVVGIIAGYATMGLPATFQGWFLLVLGSMMAAQAVYKLYGVNDKKKFPVRGEAK